MRAKASAVRRRRSAAELRAVVGREVGEHGLVVRGIGHHCHAVVVLGGATDQRRPADVDVLDAVLEGRATRHGGGEGIEIRNQEIDRRDAVPRDRFQMVGPVAPRQESAVDCRMQRLDPPVQHFRKAGDGGDVDDGEPGLGERPRGAAGGDQLDPARRQRLGEWHEAGLVMHGKKGPLHWAERVGH